MAHMMREMRDSEREPFLRRYRFKLPVIKVIFAQLLFVNCNCKRSRPNSSHLLHVYTG